MHRFPATDTSRRRRARAQSARIFDTRLYDGKNVNARSDVRHTPCIYTRSKTTSPGAVWLAVENHTRAPVSVVFEYYYYYYCMSGVIIYMCVCVRKLNALSPNLQLWSTGFYT